MPPDKAFDSPRCPTCGYRLRGLRSKRCPECGDAFDASHRWWRALWFADDSRADRRAVWVERAFVALGLGLMCAGAIFWWNSAAYESMTGMRAANWFRLDGVVAIATVAALWYCRKTDEPMHLAVPVAGVAWLTYGLLAWFLR